MKKDIWLYLLLILVIALVWYCFIKADKDRCEKAGGIYVWEFNEGNKCHIVKDIDEQKS